MAKKPVTDDEFTNKAAWLGLVAILIMIGMLALVYS